MPVTITEVRSTERFVGTEEQPRQVLHVTIERSMRDGEIRLEVTGVEPPGSVLRRRRTRHPDRAAWGSNRTRGRAAGPARARRGRRRDRRPRERRRRQRWRGRGIRNRRRRRTGLDDGHGVALPLRPGLVEHAGVVHDRLGLRRAGLVDATGVRGQRVRPRRGPPQAGRPRPGLPLRPGRARLPQALLRHVPGAASGAAAAARRGPGGARRRDLQRAEHQPHQQRDDDPELRLRHRLPARHSRRRPADRLAAGRVRPRPPVSRASPPRPD